MIRLSGLRFTYGDGDFELRIPELTIERGERVAVVGPSGSGKTTLLHLIAGIATPTGGSVSTLGCGLAALSDAQRRDLRIKRIGLVFQEFELLDNLLVPYRINAALRLDAAVRARAEALAIRVGIGDKLARGAGRLSQGERQRVAVCRALITEPELLLADEPTGNLDPSNKGRVLDILLEYAEQRGATLVTVTHDHDLLPRFARTIDFKSFAQ